MLITRGLLLVAVMFAANVSVAASTQDAPASRAEARPRIGLVLGGGGAKGAAHIGVIKVLEELHIPIDCIAGTSMGALVGGAYASGKRGEELDRFVRSIEWAKVFGTERVRRYQPIDVKREDESFSNRLEFGVGDSGLIAPRGLFDTQQIESVIRNMVATQSGVRDFDKLPIPFRAIATDLKSGQMVVFSSGDLATALRASMSVPGAFPPLEIGDQLLVDGGITRNLPVDVARESCADVVIAIAVDTTEPDMASMRTATGSVNRMLSILIDKNEKESMASLGDSDVGIRIVLHGVGPTDFTKVASAIDQGEAAARQSMATLARFAVTPGEYLAWRAHTGGPPPDAAATAIADVTFKGVDADTAQYLRRLVKSKPGQPLDEKQIADDALRIFATGQYESVAHRVEGGDPATVVFTPVLKSWGPTFLTFDYGLEAGSGSQSEVVVSARLRRTWPELRGMEWNSLAQVGSAGVVATGLRVPLDDARRWFVLPRARWSSEVEDFFRNGKRVASYDYQNLQGEFRLGLATGSWGEVQAGVYRRVDNTTRLIGDPALPDEKSYDDGGYLVEFERDTRDAGQWAAHGSRQHLELRVSDTSLGAEHEYQTGLLEWAQSTIRRRNLLTFMEVAGGTSFGSIPPTQQAFRFGGPGAMSALERGEQRGTDFAYTRLGVGWNVAGEDSLLGLNLFAGVALEVGSIWITDLDDPFDDIEFGSQLFLGGNTPIGPVTLSLGLGERGNQAFYVEIGRPTRGRWQ